MLELYINQSFYLHHLNLMSYVLFLNMRKPLDLSFHMVAQMVKSLPAMQETRVQSLDQEDPLEEGMATHSSILAWRIPWTEEPGRLQSLGLQRVRHNWAANNLTYRFEIDSDINYEYPNS